jgi:Arc/MetJ family transcription regulator
MRKRTTIDLDIDLVREAGSALGTSRTTDTIHAALADVVRRRQRAALFATPNELDLAMLEEIRADRVTMRSRPMKALVDLDDKEAVRQALDQS